jgi:RNA polymerase sigma-70 factor (ECF subfamily)
MASPDPQLHDLLQSGYRYALALSHDRHVAEDLLQEASVSVARRGGPWKKSYLMTVIRNKFVDHCRRHNIVQFVPLEEPHHVPSTNVPDTLIVSDDLERALGSLGAPEREMLYLSAVEGYSTREIQTLTGRPRGSVLSAIHRAKEKLRRLLRDNVTPAATNRLGSNWRIA